MAWSRETVQLIQSAVWEDLGADGDITSGLLDPAAREVAARITPRQDGVIAGLALLPAVLAAFNRRLDCHLSCRLADDRPADEHALRERDGQPVRAGAPVARLCGPQAAVLTAERTALNFLGRMSGVATLTRRFVEVAQRARAGVQVLDTRKTLPGWRELDKYAVRCGGGANHRFGLYDAVLLKDNHLAGIPPAALPGWLEARLQRLTATPPPVFVEVEVDSLEQLQAVLEFAAGRTAAGAAGGERGPTIDIVLLDNFPIERVPSAVALRDRLGRDGRPLLEVSGGVRLENVAAYAAAGVDRISIGALTHSAASLDIGLDV
jgi:nicotinate-nucleotide pyrophosphorylase (carboxylating)